MLLAVIVVFNFSATAYNWLPLIASVLVAVTKPAATFWTRRSVPTAPTVTVPLDLAPAKSPYVTPLTSALETEPIAPPV